MHYSVRRKRRQNRKVVVKLYHDTTRWKFNEYTFARTQQIYHFTDLPNFTAKP